MCVITFTVNIVLFQQCDGMIHAFGMVKNQTDRYLYGDIGFSGIRMGRNGIQLQNGNHHAFFFLSAASLVLIF